MFHKRKIKKHFPLDFYGTDDTWRFVIRAEHPCEVLEAMYWRAYISCHRKDFDLLHMATDKFTYRKEYSAAESCEFDHGVSGSIMRVNMVGPVVPVSAILAGQQPDQKIA